MECIREFPHFLQLQEDYPEQVACISVNTNFTGAINESPLSHREKVEGFLRDRGAHGTHVICSTPDEELYKQLKLVAIPAVYVYDRGGKLIKRFDNAEGDYGDEGFSYQEHIVPLLKEHGLGE